jgi:hypothetical protein
LAWCGSASWLGGAASGAGRVSAFGSTDGETAPFGGRIASGVSTFGAGTVALGAALGPGPGTRSSGAALGFSCDLAGAGSGTGASLGAVNPAGTFDGGGVGADAVNAGGAAGGEWSATAPAE